MENKKNLIIGIGTGVAGVSILATSLVLVSQIDYNGVNPRQELENLASKIKNVAFKSEIFDNSTTYKKIKEQLFDASGKLRPNIELSKFLSFYTVINSRISKIELNFSPEKPIVEFISFVPNDENQSFDLKFRIRHKISDSYTAFSPIFSQKIAFAQRSQFALADFNTNLQKMTNDFRENIQNLRQKDFVANFSSQNSKASTQKIPMLTRVEDFAKDINSASTSEEAVEKISMYFPDFERIIFELNSNKKNQLALNQGKIFDFTLDRNPGTNEFIKLSPTLVPSFLIKAELTNEAKFDLKGLQIEAATMVEKIDLVPKTRRTFDTPPLSSPEVAKPEKKTVAQSQPFQSGGSSTQPGTSGGSSTPVAPKPAVPAPKRPAPAPKPPAKPAVPAPSAKPKTPSYFADVDEILEQINFRKLTFSDFKVSSTAQSQTVSMSTSVSGVLEDKITTFTQFSSVSSEPQPVAVSETAPAAPAAPAPAEKTPVKPELDPTKLLEVAQKTVSDFIDKLNAKVYKSLYEKSEAAEAMINSDFLINPLSLDFGGLSKFFPEKSPEGIDFYLDIAKAKIKKEASSTSLEIPTKINLYSNFFGDSKAKLLKSKEEILTISGFKTEGTSSNTENGTPNLELDKSRQDYYALNSLPSSSPQLVTVAVSTQSTATTNSPREIKIVSANPFITKTELEELIKAQKFQEIKDILVNPFQYGFNFDANEAIVKSWVGEQNFPSLKDFQTFKPEANKTVSEVKTLRSDKFFADEFDVAAFYSHLAGLEPAQALQYFLAIAKANNLVDQSEVLNQEDIENGNVFNAAAKVKFKLSSSEKIHGFDFNNQTSTFHKRAWISDLFLPKDLAAKLIKPGENSLSDDVIFDRINKIQISASNSSSGGNGQGNGDIYKEIREGAKKLEEGNSSSGSSSGSSTSNGGNQETIDKKIKEFFTSKTDSLNDLRDLLLAFYVKAKELKSFVPWAKINEDLQYQIVFEKQTGSPSDGIEVPSGSESYKLTYYYKLIDRKTKKEEYQTPKTVLKFIVSKDSESLMDSQDNIALNKAILQIPPSLSTLYFKKEEFDKLAPNHWKKWDPTSDTSCFEKTEKFKEISAFITKFNPNFKAKVISEAVDQFDSNSKIIILEATKEIKSEKPEVPPKTTPTNYLKSSLNFQIKVVLDDTIKSPATKTEATKPMATKTEAAKPVSTMLSETTTTTTKTT
ncbi:P97 family adhesin [Mycoplasma sp. 'Moose RK']|uniref:P97 family adhesin n=1 Tax=Mycoplasma sp. 'Moose RK' TaxID=2780095 RepID=UPI0018C2394D|nr:adhesin [Mycoplasma sp. 'Moose RK']MBG0730557.1 adhesin [Mycoplasma sp. 'Moose RK']